MATDSPVPKRLRVLVANERADRLAEVARIVGSLGHDVLTPQMDVAEVGSVTARERPDVAFVGLGEDAQHALNLIEQIVHQATCPVIALLPAADPDFVVEAAKRGVFAHVTGNEPHEWQNSIEIALRRFAQLSDLEGAFMRRLATERAKGILMERHAVDDLDALRILQEHARTAKSTIVDAAEAIVAETPPRNG